MAHPIYTWFYTLNEFSSTIELFLEDKISWEDIRPLIEDYCKYIQNSDKDADVPKHIELLIYDLEKDFAIMPRISQIAFAARIIRPVIDYWDDWVNGNSDALYYKEFYTKFSFLEKEDVSLYGICYVVKIIIIQSITSIKQLTEDYNIDFNEVYRIAANKIETPSTDNISEPKKPYITLPRTHRIAAVQALINKLGLCKNIDKTRIAEFVEAVTGGNIETKGKDTVSYKKPTADAIAGATELLKKIGID